MAADSARTAELFERIRTFKAPADTHLEIECRVRTTAKFTDLAKLFAVGTWTTEQTINIIDEPNVKIMYFVAGQQDKQRLAHYEKLPLTRGIHVQGVFSARLAVSTERKIPAFTPSASAQVARIKLRRSAKLSDLTMNLVDSWRVDCTITQQCSVVAIDELRKHKERLFVRGELSKSDAIEIELEYIGDPGELTESAFSAAYSTFCEVLSGAGIEPEVKIDLPGRRVDGNRRGHERQSRSGPRNEHRDKRRDRDEHSQPSASAYQALLYKIATLVTDNPEPFRHRLGIKQLSNQVIELNKNVFAKELAGHMDTFLVCDKLDGQRYLVVIGPQESFAVGHDHHMLDVRSPEGITVLDAEFYMDAYYPFDCLMYKGQRLTNQPTTERLAAMEKAIVELGEAARLRSKPWFELTADDYREKFAELAARKNLPYKTDGLILTPKSDTYFDMRVFKYKPVEHLTIDFLARKVPANLIGRQPYIAPRRGTPVAYALLCGIRAAQRDALRLYPPGELADLVASCAKPDAPYVPCVFRPSSASNVFLYWGADDSMDNVVGEFRWSNNVWELVKRRDDRRVEVARKNYFGNNMRVAESIWMNIGDPLDISTFDAGGAYFKEHGAQDYQAQRKINNAIKRAITESAIAVSKSAGPARRLIDFASGNGQDLFKYAKAGITRFMGMDVDSCALMELCDRKYSLNPPESMQVSVQRVDLLAKASKTIGAIEAAHTDLPERFDVAMCHMAAHYFMESEKTCANFAECVVNFLGPGGIFVMTMFDGARIASLLASHDGQWESKDSRYLIKYAADANDQEKKFSRRISVRLPFSKTALYDEWLADIERIKECFAEHGLELQRTHSFAEMSKKVDPKILKDATDEDLEFVGLYAGYEFIVR